MLAAPILKHVTKWFISSFPNMAKHAQLSDNQVDDIAEVISRLPMHDEARYQQLMREIWKVDGKYIQNEVPEAKSLEQISWDDVPEQAKYAIQCWLQRSGPPSCDMGDYESSIGAQCQAVNQSFASLPSMPSLPVLDVIKDNLERIEIGCSGCALTFDLLIFMIRGLLTSAKIQRSCDPVERLETLMKHFDNLKGCGDFLAHCAAGLPNVVVSYHTEAQSSEAERRAGEQTTVIGANYASLEHRRQSQSFASGCRRCQSHGCMSLQRQYGLAICPRCFTRALAR